MPVAYLDWTFDSKAHSCRTNPNPGSAAVVITTIVTGGAFGIGYEVSKAFVSVGCRVIMINRKEDQGESAIAEIRKQIGVNAKIEWVGCDLGSLKEAKDVFTKLRNELERLDLIIYSAGINANQFRLDADGIDAHFGIMWLGQFYATNLLWPLLRKTSKLPDASAPRIVFESSEQHRAAPSVVHFGSLEEINNQEIGSLEVYGRAKLATILGMKYGLLDRVIKPNNDNIFVLCVHPGAEYHKVNTAMQQQWKDAYPGLFGNIVSKLMIAVGRDVETGSYSALCAATSPEIEKKGWNGYYLQDVGSPGKKTSQASDPTLGAALWDLSARLIKDKVGPDAFTPWDEAA
ncbi:NAD(P)-binding protein, partial [Aureobasidium melanogenum]